MSDGQALTGPSAYRLGGEKWIENPGPDFFWDSGPSVGNPDFHPVAILARAESNGALGSAAARDRIGNRMGRVDNQVQDHLVEFTGQTAHEREVRRKVRDQIRHIFPFVVRNRQSAF